MLSLFSTSSDKSGFRLQYMEVFNWGTFDEKVFRISPKGNNSLLTGANASGKSTFIDALLTLVVPAKKDRFYNQSSGVEKKGDRTEETYVLGHYGNIQEEGKSSTSTQSLRGKDTYSVILANFSNTDQKVITLFQVRWFSNGELKRQFGVAHVPLEIDKDFSEFDGKWNWKKRLEKSYNSNSTKRIIEFIEGPTAYAERISNLFGMRSVKALSLFNQVVGVKVLEDLDEFIRTNMLEEQDAESEYLQLKESFLTLMDAKINIEKAKEQIKQLRPINDLANQLKEVNERIDTLVHSKELAVYWFAKKGFELGEKELEKCTKEFVTLNRELSELRSKEDELKDQETSLSVQIKSDGVGQQIEELKAGIKRLENEKEIRIDKLDDYNKVAQKIELNSNPNEKDFASNREKAERLRLSTDDGLIVKNANLRSLENKEEKFKQETEELVETIRTLKKNENNIPVNEARIRDEIIEYIGAKKEELPFVGELIRLDENERDWEASVEKVLHNFALRLIVPPKYYSQVNEYVNSHNLKGRLRYDKYEERERLKHFKPKEDNENLLVNKIEIKPNTEYHDWIENQFETHYNFTCLENLEDFKFYSEMAIMQSGLIKFRRGKHEKDDRPHISKKGNYVLGWNNKEKINLLKSELIKLQEEQVENSEKITGIKEDIQRLSKFKDDCQELILKAEKFDDIEWQSYAKQIQENEKLKDELEKSNDKVKKLQEQLNKVRNELKNISEVKIKNKDREIFQKEEALNRINISITTNKSIFNPMGDVDVAKFEEENSDLLNIEFSNFEIRRSTYQSENSKELTEQNKVKSQKEREISLQIQKFRQPTDQITNKFKDWRSDVSTLPDSSNLEFVGEYQKFLTVLEKDNLPSFEKRFQNYLQETITNKVGDFNIFFKDWEDSIKENINHLNDSLKEIDFKNSPKTYIQLVAPRKGIEEVNNFRKLLDDAIPNFREVDASIDGRKNHFENHIEPLISKLEKEDWRKKVMDVRTWFSYKAEEFYKENDQKFKTYENMGQLSGGEKAQLTYTILGSAIAYQFGLTKEGLQSNSFRFIAIDEAFKAQDEDKARFLITLCKQLHLQLLVVTPSDNIHIVENDISFIHFVERKQEKTSWLYDMPIEQFKAEKEQYLSQ